VSLQETFHHRRSAVFSKIGQHYSYVEKERPSAMRGYKRGVMIMAKKGGGITLTKMDARYKPTSFEYIVGGCNTQSHGLGDSQRLPTGTV